MNVTKNITNIFVWCTYVYQNFYIII